MHSLILFIAIVVLTFSGGICQYVGPEKNQTIELFSEGVSAWISSDQYYQIFSSLENDMYNENSCTQMSINVAVYISQVMTAAQAAKFTAIIANITVNSNLNVADLYVILGNHLRATVCTFWDGDFLANVSASKAQNLTRDQVLQFAYINWNNWMTKSVLRNLFRSLVSDFSARTTTVSLPPIPILNITLFANKTYWQILCPPFREIFLVAYLAYGIDCVGCIDHGWVYYTSTNKCYKDSPQIENFYSDAKAYCVSQGGNLVSIHSLDENNFIRDNVVNPYGNNTTPGFYIGFRKFNATTNVRVWEDGTAVDFRNWAPGQPDGQAPPANITRMIGIGNTIGMWDDIPDTATNSKRVLCEQSAS